MNPEPTTTTMTTTTTETAHVDWASVERIGADRPVPHLLVVRARTGDPETLTDEVTLEPGDYLELVQSGDRWRYRWDIARVHRATARPDVLDPGYTPPGGLLAWAETHHDVVATVHREIPAADVDLLAEVYGSHWLPGLLANWTAALEASLQPGVPIGYAVAELLDRKVPLLRDLVQRLRWCQSVTGLPQ